MIQEKPKTGQLYQVKNLVGEWVNAVYSERDDGNFAQWEVDGGGFLFVSDVSEWREVGV